MIKSVGCSIMWMWHYSWGLLSAKIRCTSPLQTPGSVSLSSSMPAKFSRGGKRGIFEQVEFWQQTNQSITMCQTAAVHIHSHILAKVRQSGLGFSPLRWDLQKTSFWTQVQKAWRTGLRDHEWSPLRSLSLFAGALERKGSANFFRT